MFLELTSLQGLRWSESSSVYCQLELKHPRTIKYPITGMMVENLGPYHGHTALQRPSSSSPRPNEGVIPRHKIDMKCLELRQMLQSKGVRDDEVDDKVNSSRALLTRQCLDSGESKRRISSYKDSAEQESPLRDLHRSGQKHRSDLDARSSSRRKKKKRKRDQRKKRRRRSSSSYSESSLDRESASKVRPKIVSYDDDDDEDENNIEGDEFSPNQDKKKSRRKKKSRSKTKSRSRSRGRSRQRSHEKRKKKKKTKYSGPDQEPAPRRIGKDAASSPLPKLKRMIAKRRFSQDEDLSPQNRFTGEESQGKQIVISSIDDIPTLDDNGKPVVKGLQSPSGSDSKTVEPNAWDSPELETKSASNGTGSLLLRPSTGKNLKFPKFLPKIIGTSILNNNNQGPGSIQPDQVVKTAEVQAKVSEDPIVESDRERKRSWSRSRSRSYSSHHDSRSSSRYSHSQSRSRSRSRSGFRSSRSRSYSRSYSRSRSRSRSPPRSRTRSPSLPRRTGSPSFKERRRITSARKRPIPYRRKPSHWGHYSSSSERSYDSRSRSRSRSWSRSRSRSPR